MEVLDIDQADGERQIEAVALFAELRWRKVQDDAL